MWLSDVWGSGHILMHPETLRSQTILPLASWFSPFPTRAKECVNKK